MNITNDIIAQLKGMDLSTEAAVVERYEALANSPVILFCLLRSCTTDVSTAYKASKENPEVIADVFRDKLKEYATIGRTDNKRRTIKDIRRHIGVLFAQWEDEEKAGGLPAANGYLYAYAMNKGFNPDGESLSEKDTAALDDLAEFIFSTIEAYFLFSLTGKKTAVDGLLSHKVSEATEMEIERLKNEIRAQFDVLFAPEWENSGDGLTTSCEVEVNFFGDEADSYATGVIENLADIELAKAICKVRKENAPEWEGEACQRAQESRYKDYIKANAPC